MKGETNLVPDEYWKLMAGERILMKERSDKRLQNAKQERDQIAVRDPDRAVELEGEVRRLAQVMDEIQGKRKPPSWRIMLDDESPLSAEIMGIVIPRDFCFPDLKYSGRSDPLMHIERFNDMTGVHGLTPAQRCMVFPFDTRGTSPRMVPQVARRKYKRIRAYVPRAGRTVPRSGSPRGRYDGTDRDEVGGT